MIVREIEDKYGLHRTRKLVPLLQEEHADRSDHPSPLEIMENYDYLKDVAKDLTRFAESKVTETLIDFCSQKGLKIGTQDLKSLDNNFLLYLAMQKDLFHAPCNTIMITIFELAFLKYGKQYWKGKVGKFCSNKH